MNNVVVRALKDEATLASVAGDRSLWSDGIAETSPAAGAGCGAAACGRSSGASTAASCARGAAVGSTSGADGTSSALAPSLEPDKGAALRGSTSALAGPAEGAD